MVTSIWKLTSVGHQNKKTYVVPRQSLGIEVPGPRKVVIEIQYRTEDRAIGLYQKTFTVK